MLPLQVLTLAVEGLDLEVPGESAVKDAFRILTHVADAEVTAGRCASCSEPNGKLNEEHLERCSSAQPLRQPSSGWHALRVDEATPASLHRENVASIVLAGAVVERPLSTRAFFSSASTACTDAMMCDLC